MYKIKYSNRKFYNKWLFKVTLNLKGGTIFRDRSADDVIFFCIEPVGDRVMWGRLKDASNNKENILKVGLFLSNNNNSVYTKRIEGSTFDLYTNDKEFYNKICAELTNLVTCTYEPLAGQEDLIRDSSSIVTTKLPHNKYRYKVYLLPHKLKGDKDRKTSFLSWIDSQNPRIRISEAVKAWFFKTEWNWDRRYILVEDEQTLFMLQLRNAEVIGRIYNYHLVDK